MRIKIKRKIQGFVLMIFVIFTFLSIGEVIVRVNYDYISNYDTEMWKYASFAKQLSEDPLISHVHKPNVNIDLYGVNVKINSKGLREYEYEYEKPEDVKRILVLGDSITFGWGVDFEDIYSKVLERKLRDYQVINTGVGNYNTNMEVVFLNREGLKYEPDLIILGYYINDAELTPKTIGHSIKKYSYLYGYLWSKYVKSIGRFSRRGNYMDYYLGLYDDNFEGRILFEKSINELKGIAKEKNIPLLIVIIPELHNLKDYPFENINEFIKGFEDSNTYVLDILPYLNKDNPSLLWVSEEDLHPNKIVNKVIADAIYEKLIKHNLI